MTNFTQIDLHLLYRRETGNKKTVDNIESKEYTYCNECGEDNQVSVTIDEVPDSDYVKWLENEFIKLKQKELNE